jgi:ribosomal protein S18 acetylase RimI-like enzyme
MPTLTTIRPALWTDHAQLVPIVDAFAALHHAMDPSFRPRWMGFTAAIFQTCLDEPGDVHLVAEQDGVIAGYVWAGMGTGNSANYLFMRRNVFVYVLAVAEAYRRKGIGRALFQAIERAAHDFDAEIIQLAVLPANDRAKAFYRSLGYATTNETLTKPLKTIKRIDGMSE